MCLEGGERCWGRRDFTTSGLAGQDAMGELQAFYALTSRYCHLGEEIPPTDQTTPVSLDSQLDFARHSDLLKSSEIDIFKQAKRLQLLADFPQHVT